MTEDEADWSSLSDLVIPQGTHPRATTPDDVRKSYGYLLGHAQDANERANAAEREQSRVCRAIGHYAHHAPLDLKHPSEIQRDLMSICGEKHTHKASIGSDQCDLCLRDLRDDIHIRIKDRKS